MIPLSSTISAQNSKAYYAHIEKAYNTGNDVFLLNPQWTDSQRSDAQLLISNYEKNGNKNISPGRIFVASGGSGGKIRFIAHTPKTLEASAQALLAVLGLKGKPLNCFSCLPPWHISGLMPFVRSRLSGGSLCVAEDSGFHSESALIPFRKSDDEFWMNSLVPTQLRRILALPGGPEWLRRFDFILLGGSAVPNELIAHAQSENLKIGIGYGMTETASLVALWTPDNGDILAGTPLPHAKITLAADSRILISAGSLGETLASDGTILPNPDGIFLTNDEGALDSHRRILVLGRADRYINSGGEKIDPALVERALLRAGADAALVVGEKDDEWGERVVALVVTALSAPALLAETKKILPGWMAPKRILSVSALPFDAKGKLDRTALRAMLGSNPKID